MVDLLNRGDLVRRDRGAGGLTAKRSRPEMAPQRLEKIESAPGNGWARKPRTYKMWYTGPWLTVSDSGSEAARMTKLRRGQKKAPKALKSLDAGLKSAPA